MKPTVYIETTIAGHLTSHLPRDIVVAGQMLSTRDWWTSARQKYELVTSDVVIEEAGRGDALAAADRLAVLSTLPTIPILEIAEKLAANLINSKILPPTASVDALHVAIAATNSVRYLVTWNCRHLANADLREKISAVCRQCGFASPIICTPLELT